MNDFEVVSVFLKNGQQVTIRAAHRSDETGVARFFRQAVQETEFLSMQIDEVGSDAEVGRFLHAMERSGHSLFLVAAVPGMIVGMGQVSFSARRKSRHRAVISVAVSRKLWGLGLGSALLNAMTAFAVGRGATQLELTVMADNVRAIALYERFGFKAVGRMPNAYLMSDGGFRDEISMVKPL